MTLSWHDTPSTHLKVGHHRPASEMPFDGGPTLFAAWAVEEKPKGCPNLPAVLARKTH